MLLTGAMLLFLITGCAGVQGNMSANLLLNGSFEQPMTPSDWIIAPDLQDWNGEWLASSVGAMQRVQDDAAPDGDYYMKFIGFGPNTLASPPVPYHGEEILVEGWFLTENLVSDYLRPIGGEVQIVGLDAQGRFVEAHTLLELNGTSGGWKLYYLHSRLGPDVRQISLYIRFRIIARGLFAFDGLSLRLKTLHP